MSDVTHAHDVSVVRVGGYEPVHREEANTWRTELVIQLVESG